jgi:hypothetical protein
MHLHIVLKYNRRRNTPPHGQGLIKQVRVFADTTVSSELISRGYCIHPHPVEFKDMVLVPVRILSLGAVGQYDRDGIGELRKFNISGGLDPV